MSTLREEYRKKKMASKTIEEFLKWERLEDEAYAREWPQRLAFAIMITATAICIPIIILAVFGGN